MLGPLAGPDERGGFKAIHLRHFHIEEDGRKIVVEKKAQSLNTGVSLDQIMVGALEDRLETEQVSRIVIHQENLGLVGKVGGRVGLGFRFPCCSNHASAPTPRKAFLASSWPRAIHTRSTEKSCSRSTGFGI